ncbi:MAG: hypothetical protein ACK5ZR_16825 [Gemmatimonadaceae bacterium]
MLLLFTSRADAQLGGVLRRLPGGVGDAARAAEMLKQAQAAREIPSRIAGTYRLVFTFGPPDRPSDSSVYFVRTFEKPSTGNVGGDLPTPERARPGQMTQGYTLTIVASESLEALPASADRASMSQATGGGFAVTYPFAGDSTQAQSFGVDWVVLLPKNASATNDAFNRRMDRARSGGIVRADGTGEPRAVNRLALIGATTVLAPDGSVRVSFGLRRGRDFVAVRGERISTERYTSP